ncbi:MAG: T9SS type A sorting domain-containing protein [Bacteroidota bacterium]
MKKTLLKLFGLGVMTFGSTSLFAQTMYLDEMFNVSKQANIVYDSNRSVNILFGQVPGQPPIIGVNLTCDVYTPVGSTVANRPTVIIAHTGSFLPAITNQQTTGNKNDSAVVEMCTRLAKRGYNAVAVNYRLGWNSLATPPASTEQLLNATYRGMVDVRNAIRFLRTNAGTYGVDTSKIIVGGQGTGGYIALAIATVNKASEINNIIKFQRNDFTPMVSIDTLGDWNGIGGNPFFNVSGDANIASNAHMVFHYGGAMGDLIWLDENSLPIVGMQSDRDPFAPFTTGNVIVPTNMTTVIPSASGAGHVVPKANDLGVNDKLNTKYLVDPISRTLRARANGVEHLYPVRTNFPQDAGPWEWWDRPTMQARTNTLFYNIPLPADGRRADSISMLANPDMSEPKARKYIDTLVDFVTRRMAVQFDLVPSSNDATNPNYKLLSPPNNTSALIKGDSTETVAITWEPANTTGFGDVTYTWKAALADDIDFADPVIEAEVPTMPMLVLDYGTISDILAGAGLEIGDSIDLAWTVEASVNGTSVWSADTFGIRLTKGQINSVKEIAQVNNYLTVYPNPANDVLNISMDNKAGAATAYAVVDVTGRTVLSGNASANQFNVSLSSVKPGLYFVQVMLNDGSVATKRIVVQ